MGAKHTPGPWRLEKSIGSDDMDCGWGVEAEQNYPYRGQVCSLCDAEHIDGITKAERDANARLIAAAPCLLEALEEARAGLKWYQDRFPDVTDGSDDEADARIAAAIAKATGETSPPESTT